jgi:outer membrane protein OmpA-like peptidoglycan-associated protein
MPIAARVRAPVDLKSIKAPPPPPAIIKTILKPEPTTKTQLTSKTEQTASIVPRASGIKAGTEMRVVFNLRESKLPEGAKKSLLAVTNKMKAAVTLRLRLQAYAGSESMSSSKARRLSLSRALSVRSYLIKSGIQSSRIDVRALGNKSTEKPINRVDVNVVER